MKREGILEEEVLGALREHGLDDLTGVKSAILELDGTISVIPLAVSASHTRRRVRGRTPGP
jgi:uncharacterized membrane protein YcaP (DUF421 family)